jgi:hypothetical protein
LLPLWCCCLCWPLLELLGPLDPLGLLVLGRRASCLVRAE